MDEQQVDHADQKSIGSSIRRLSGEQTEPFPPFPLPESPDISSKPNSINDPGNGVNLAGESSRRGTDVS